MARGWESKSIESQMESAESRRNGARSGPVSPVEAERARQRKACFSRAHESSTIFETAKNPGYREVLRPLSSISTINLPSFS